MKQDLLAPDGSPIEVHRNHGKPDAAARIAQALKSRRGRKEASDPTPIFPPTAAAASAAPAEGTPAGNAAAPPKATRARKAQPAPAEPAAAQEASPAPASPDAPAPAPASPDAPAEAPAPKPGKRPMQVRFTGMKPMHVVEAALFSAGKPVSVEEMAETTGLPPDAVRAGIKELQGEYERRDTVLEVGKAGAKWAMQVKTQAAEPAARFAPMEIPAKVLKTLALIAFHQPMRQSELVEMMGTKVYDHVPELVSRGLVKAREEGATKVLVTTAQFPEYFGLDAASPEEIRAVMGRLVGIEAAPKPSEPTVEYVEPQGQPPADGTQGG